MTHTRWNLRIVALVAAILFFSPTGSAAHAQQTVGGGTGRVVGRVVDAAQGSPIAGAQVEVVGTALRTVSAIDGRYMLNDVPLGPVEISVRMIGYQAKRVQGLTVVAGSALEQNVSLTQVTVQLEEIAVSGEVERGTVAAALDEQRNATQIVNAITAEQISKSPDSDAGAAIQRVSGISVQDGKYVTARGLGDRYTTASLNGSRIPSPEPEKKVVPLDLFPAALLEGVTTTKTFTPDQAGDFSGAQVNIKTKEFPTNRTITFSVGTGVNTRALGSDRDFAPRTNKDFVALGSQPRALPVEVAEADFSQTPPPEVGNSLINSFRNVWSTKNRSGSPNASFGLSLGGTDRVFGQEIGYIASGSYGYSSDINYDAYRGLALAGANGQAETSDLYAGEQGRYSVLWGGIMNLTTNVGSHSKFSINNSYNRTMDNEGRYEEGRSENLATELQLQRLRYVERAVFATQVTGLHALGRRHQVEWAGSYSDIQRKEPDRSEMVYSIDRTSGQPVYSWYGISNEAAVRTFGDLDEQSVEGKLDYTLFLGAADGRASVKVGGLLRNTQRDAINDVYSISLNSSLTPAELQLAPEQIFDGRYTSGDQSVLRISPLSQAGSYDADETIASGYAMLTVPLGARLSLVGGARVENWDLMVHAFPATGGALDVPRNQTDVLPALALTYRLRDNQNLRFAASRTLNRPDYRELVEILQRDVIGGDNLFGNRNLERATVDNFDLRWEFFPTPAEVLSVSFFAKSFDKPIERVYQATSGTRIITPVNAKSATNLGVELEARKNLGFLSNALNSFVGFANLTVMNSEVDIDTEGVSVTDQNRRMVGQSPYVVNLGTTYTSGSGAWSATVLYNVVGPRITEAGEIPLPNVEEKPRHMVDLSLRFPVAPALTGKLDARNLLDAPYRRFQGDVVRERYLTGRVFSLGFTWAIQ